MKFQGTDLAREIIMGRYARPEEKTPEEIIHRMVDAWIEGGNEHGHFTSQEEAEEMRYDLLHDMLNQWAAPNSPQWFNTGVVDKPQVHACFINSVEDDLESINHLWLTETKIFKRGSGSGVNVSNIREAGAPLSGGGTSSGVMSFLSVGDRNAGAIKSGGTTRRAALMRIMDVDHPDIEEFIQWKVKEEEKVRWLVQGSGGQLDYDWRGEAYRTVDGQNSNNSINISDSFMRKVLNNEDHELLSRVSSEPTKIVNAKDLLMEIATAAHKTGDPAVVFGDTMNAFNTAANSGTIRSTNPCGEYVFLDDTACNLASINVAQVWRDNPDFFWAELRKAAFRWTIVLDISIDIAGYPTPVIEARTKNFRTLGLGMTGLHELLIMNNLRYDSDEGRALASRCMKTIRDAAIDASKHLAQIIEPAPKAEENAEHLERIYGTSQMRNFQLTVIAPTGTISFAMDAKSTGCEPIFSHDAVKTLAGGGEIDLSSGYGDDIETAATVSSEGHLKMVAELQKHVCGGISKTINMPSEATPEEIFDVYVEAWKSGIKAVSVYRDGSKASQPMKSSSTTPQPIGARRPLPSKRNGYTQKATVGNQSLYIRTGEYADGSLGELFLDMGKQGGAYGGVLSAFAKSVSIGLQYGVPLETFVDSFKMTRMEPSGLVFDHDTVKTCTSTIDLVFQDLEASYLSEPTEVPIGDPCPECGGFNMISTGTCTTCTDCGATTGCG